MKRTEHRHLVHALVLDKPAMHYLVSLQKHEFPDNIDYKPSSWKPFQRLLPEGHLAMRDTARALVQENTGIETSVFDWRGVYDVTVYGQDGFADVTHHVIVTILDLGVMTKARNLKVEVVPIEIGIRNSSEMAWIIPLSATTVLTGRPFQARNNKG